MSYPEHIELAIRLGLQIRQRALDTRHEMDGVPADLTGACGICSYWLWWVLRRLRPGKFALIVGAVGFNGHAWVEDEEGTVVDLTATQFFYGAQPVEVMGPYFARHTRRYQAEIRNAKAIRDINMWCPNIRPTTHRRAFLPLVRKLVQEELATGYKDITNREAP